MRQYRITVFLLTLAIICMCGRESSAKALLVPAFSKFSTANGAVDAGVSGTNTMQVLGATLSMSGGKPTMTIDANGSATVDVKSPSYGAKGDAKILSNGYMSTGSAVFTSYSGAFTSSDVGKSITVTGAGAANTTASGGARFPLQTTIAAWVNSQTVTLAAAAQATVSHVTFLYGSDDTAALQAAVNAGVGKTTIIPPGRYFVKTDYSPTLGFPKALGGVNLPSNTRLQLMPGAYVQGIPNAVPTGNLFVISEVDNVTITGGNLAGDRAYHDYNYTAAASTHEQCYGVAVLNATNVTIDQVNVSGFTGDGLFIGGISSKPMTDRVKVTSCDIDASRRNNISVTYASNVDISGNSITNAGVSDANHAGTSPMNGIDIESGLSDYTKKCKNVSVRGNTFTGNMAAGITNYDGIQVSITGNQFDSGISYGYGYNTTISSNQLVARSGLASPAVGITGSIGTLNIAMDRQNNLIVADNTVKGFDIGVNVNGAGITVSGNRIYEPTTTGIQLGTVNGALVSDNFVGYPITTQAAKTITAITQANPAAATSTAHGLVTGDKVQITAVAGMYQLTNKAATVTVVDANTFTLDGVNSTSYGAFTSGQFTKIANYFQTVTAVTKANPAAVTSASHGLVTGDYVRFGTMTGMTQLSNFAGKVTVVDANTFTLDGVDSTSYGTFSAGTFRKSFSFDNSMTGISSGPSATNVKIVHNELENCGSMTESAIKSSSPSIEIEGNSIHYSYRGINVSAGIVEIRGNTIDLALYPDQAPGILISGASTRATVEKNEIHAGRTYAIQVTSGSLFAARNLVNAHAGSQGISVTGAGSFQILDNIVEYTIGSAVTTATYAIYVSGATGAIVVGNKTYSTVPASILRAVDTSGSSASYVVGNVSIGAYGGAFVTAADDSISGNRKDIFDQDSLGAAVASASTITPSAKIFHVTGTTTINQINTPYAAWSGSITIIPDAVFTLGTTGNIATASTSVVGKPMQLVYDTVTAKWYPSY